LFSIGVSPDCPVSTPVHGADRMLKRYKVYPYLGRNRELKLATEVNDIGDWVKYRDCNDRVKDLADDNIALQNRVAILEKKYRLLTDALRWYSDVENWLPSSARDDSTITEVDLDQGKRAQAALLELGIDVNED
jgi:hypothetical protein